MSKLTSLTIVLVLWAAGSTSCAPWAACEGENASLCGWDLLPNSKTISRSSDSSLRVEIHGPTGTCRSANFPTLLTSPSGKQASLDFHPISSDVPCQYEGIVLVNNVTEFSDENAALTFVNDKSEIYKPLNVKIKHALNFTQINKSFIDMTGTMNFSQPQPIGVNVLSDGQVVILQQGKSAGAAARRLKFLSYNNATETLDTAATQPAYFGIVSWDFSDPMNTSMEALVPPSVSISSDRIFVTPKWINPKGYEILDCSKSAADSDACLPRTTNTTASDLLPANTKSFVAGSFGKMALLSYVDSAGSLFTALIEPGTTTQLTAANWTITKPTSSVPTVRVLISIGDGLLAAGQATIIVTYQAPAMGTQVFSAVTVSDKGQVSPLPDFAKHLDSLVGSTLVEALAIGKIDSDDALSDIAISQPGKISFLINTGIKDTFALDAFQIPGLTQVGSLAIGQVDGAGGNDLVVALPTENKVTAFLNKPRS